MERTHRQPMFLERNDGLYYYYYYYYMHLCNICVSQHSRNVLSLYLMADSWIYSSSWHSYVKIKLCICYSSIFLELCFVRSPVWLTWRNFSGQAQLIPWRMETHHTQLVSVAMPVGNPMSELRNHAAHANHLRGEGWNKKKVFCLFFPLFLSYKIRVSNFHKGK